MWRSFVILFIVTTNLCTFLDSYKITIDKGTRLINASDQKDSDLEDGYAEGLNYSNEEESHKQSSGRVVIGKWRNNGEAFEPKWRDGDSVPLAPFSTMSFNSGWKRKGPDSREDYQIEPDTFNTGSMRKNGDFQSVESRTGIENERKNYNVEKYVKETTQRTVGYKNANSKRDKEENGSGLKYRETLQSYPNEYELFENENDDPRPRKRRPPQNYEFPTISDKRPEPEPMNRTRIRENVELKTFLKMQGNDLSLSEILQQKNLTLADILRGKPNAIKILKSNETEPDIKTPATSITEISPSTSGYLRWSPSRKIAVIKSDNIVSTTPSMKAASTIIAELIKDNETSFDSYREDNKSKDSEHEFLKPLEENRESLSVDATSNERDSSVISSGGKLASDNNDDDEIMEFSDYPSKMPMFVAPIIYDTGRRKIIPHSVMRVSDPVEESDSKLSIENILPTGKTTDVETIDGVNLSQKSDESGIESTMISEKEENYSTTSKPDDKNLTLNHKFHDVVIPKVDPQSRAEILELFSSGSSVERLERLLASRNMTIEELIALRQRGSSQVHFAEVFKTKELRSSSSSGKVVKKISADPKNETSIDDATISKNRRKETDLFDQLSKNVNLNPDKSDRKLEKEDENPGLTILTDKLPEVNNIQRDSEGSSYYTSIETVRVVPPVEEEVAKIPDIFEDSKPSSVLGASLSEIGRVEEIINNDLKSIKTSWGTNDYEYSEKKSQSNNKVRPSIIASGGILGVTIVVFLAIFIACRIRQKKKFTYKNSFAKAVFHNPVMTPRKLSNTSSVNTIMVDVVATSTTKRHQNRDHYQTDDFHMDKSDIDNDSLDANDSWDTIPDFMK